MTVALVSTGGTVAMAGRGPYDWVDYAESKVIRDGAELARELEPLLPEIPLEVVPVTRIASTGVTAADWVRLRDVVAALVDRSDIDGVAIAHGTATLEETAWFLALTTATPKPIVLVGAQRPPNTAGSDAGPNLRAALLVAHSTAARDAGVLVVMDGRIFDARSVTKVANHDLDAFVSRSGGELGRVLASGDVVIRHLPVPLPGDRPWAGRDLGALPRVDISYAYAGADGVDVQAFVAAGARGIVCAGLPPGRPANRQREALAAAARSGIAVVLSSRALRGSIEPASDAHRDGFLRASDLGPNKTRILLALALLTTSERGALQRILDRF